MAKDRTVAMVLRLLARAHLNVQAQLHMNRTNLKQRKYWGPVLNLVYSIETQRLNATHQRHAEENLDIRDHV